jgi:hypothetical protein
MLQTVKNPTAARLKSAIAFQTPNHKFTPKDSYMGKTSTMASSIFIPNSTQNNKSKLQIKDVFSTTDQEESHLTSKNHKSPQN